MLLQPSEINLILDNGSSLSDDLQIQKKQILPVNERILSPVPEKRKEIKDQYNLLTVEFKQPYTLLMRVYDDGVAYRLVTRFKDSVVIKNELAEFSFEPGKKALLPVVAPRSGVDRFHTSFEELYQFKSIDSLGDSIMAYSPVVTGSGEEVKVAITESDLEDYPGMFIQATGSHKLRGLFAPFPLEEQMTSGEFPQAIVTQRAGYIARIKGSRSLPWRVLMIAASDKDLPASDLVYRLGAPSRLKDISWIHPGKCTDEWIIGINLFNIPFRAGINTATYKYYIDFARQFGLDRIMMDAGWSHYQNLFDIHPDLNMDTIAAYARSKNIKLSMWTLCSTL